MGFWDYLRAPPNKAKGAVPAMKPASAAELQAALEEARLAATAAAERAAHCASERQDLLLAGTDSQIDQADRNLNAASREADRCDAAVAALESRLAEAIERERVVDLDRLYMGGTAALERGLALYKQYDEAARELIEIIREIQEAATEVDHARRLLQQRGDARTVVELDAAVRPETSAVRLARTPLWQQIKLPDAARPFDMLWPPHREIDAPPLPIRPPGEAFDPPPDPLAPGTVRWPG